MEGLTLLSPWGLALAALTLPLLLLYVLKIQRKKARVPSIWLWAKARRDLMARSPFQKLIAQVPLVLELVALVAAAVALARPVSRSPEAFAGHLALVVDVSASMSAAELGGPTRLERAKKRAHELVASVAPGTEIMVVGAGRSAKVASTLDRDVHRIDAAIDALVAEDTEGDLAASVALAVDRLSEASSPRVVVVTDGALARDPGLESVSVPVDVELVGEPIDNLGIVGVDVRASVDASTKAETTQGFVLLSNSGKSDRDVYVTMREDNASDVLASRRVMVKKGEKLPVVLGFSSTPGDRGRGLVFDVSPHDGMPIDDVAYGRVPEGQRIPVVLASSKTSPWIERALRSDPEVELSQIDPAALASTVLPIGALLVTDGVCPETAPGDALVFHPPAGACRGVDVGNEVERPTITSWAASDPRLRFLSLDGVAIARANALGIQGDRRALVRTRDAILVADGSTVSHGATVVGFDVGESDWPLKASFVLFVRNVVEEARGHRARASVSAARTGEPLLVPVPETAAMVDVERPGLEVERTPARGGLAVVPDTSRAGLYRITYGGSAGATLAVPVNLASESESDLSRTLEPRTSAALTVRARGDHPVAHREHAYWLSLLALFALLAEGAHLTRGSRSKKRSRPVLVAAVVLALTIPLWAALVWTRVVPDAYVRLARPLASPVVPLAMAFLAHRFARSEVGHRSRLRVIAHDAMLGLATIALGLALVGVELGRSLDRLTIVVAVDRSRSIDLVPGADTLIERNLAAARQRMRDRDRLGTVVFAATAASEDPPHPRDVEPSAQRVSVGRDATDLDAAIRRALAEVPSDSAARIELVTDGVATRGDTLSAATASLAAQVPIDVVMLEQRELPDVRVVSVRAPTRGNEGEAVDLRIVTSAPAETETIVTVKRDGAVVSRSKTTLSAGEDVLTIREKLPSGGLHRYEVEVSPTDPSIDASGDDNSGTAFVRVHGQASALVLEGDEGKSRFVAEALRSASFRVEEASAVGVPADLGGFARFDLVVLSDIPASALSPGQIDALASYVRDFGGGLLLLGGDRGMGPGGYGKTSIEEVSPVSFDLKQDERRASLAEVIGIDISGSMGMQVGGKTKLELANEAAARSAALLGPGDDLGVEHVDTVVHWSVPLGPITDPPGVERAIRAASVGGGGIIVPITLEAGYSALDGLGSTKKVNLKHLLLFADGDDAEEIELALPLASPAKSRGITTSVVALGSGHDVPALEQLSRLGGGRFYLIEDAARLPAVFAQETILAARSAIVEEPFRVTAGAHAPATDGIDFAAAPPLGGYVVTMPKGRASVLLGGPDGDPILAVWSAGVGRSAAFTSDLKDRWGTAWTAWPGAARLVAQTARDVARKGDDEHVRLESDASGGRLQLRATVRDDDGHPDAWRRLRARVSGPDGVAHEVELDPTGPGTYAAGLPLARTGTYLSTLIDDATGESLGVTGAVLSAGDELRPTGSDADMLRRIARLTGGRVRDTLENVFDDRSAGRLAYDDLGAVLLVVGASALLLYVAARRVSLPEMPSAASRERGQASRRPAAHANDGPRGAALAVLAARAAARERATATTVRDAPKIDPVVTRRPSEAPAPTAAPALAPRDLESPRAVAPTPIARPSEPLAPKTEPVAGGEKKRSAIEILADKKKKRGP